MLARRLNRSLTALNYPLAFFSSADVNAPMLCSDASPVQPVLDIVSGTWYVECPDAYLEAVGSTGASLDLHMISRGA